MQKAESRKQKAECRKKNAECRMQNAAGCSSEVAEIDCRLFDNVPYADIDPTSEHPPAGWLPAKVVMIE
jgi:hypothetical protein